jgi:RNA 2',3'-cyclic 3'-phosphodiesterase
MRSHRRRRPRSQSGFAAANPSSFQRLSLRPLHAAAAATRPIRGERLFVAIALPQLAREELAGALPSALPGRRVVPDKWHFTLRFLGLTASALRDRLIAELATERFGSVINLQLSGLGAFPGPARARVLWAGVTQGADRLTELAAGVTAACVRAGLASDERPYSPHLTLSRLDPPRDVRRLVREASSFVVRATLDEVLLMRSTLGQGHPRYEVLARYALAAAQ